MKRIVVVTDCVDVAYNELRGVILNELQKNKFTEPVSIEPVVPVSAYSILNGNFVLRLMAEVYPEGTIFLVILNPLKMRPARIYGKTRTKNFTFVGANTGIFNWLLKDYGISELFELTDPGFISFGGKYVHAPAVAKLVSGVSLESLGSPYPPEKILSHDIADGTIVHIDNFGLMKFTGTLPDFSEGQQLSISAGGKSFFGVYSKRMMSRETGEWVVYPGSSLGLPELGMVRGNGAVVLDAKIGDKITFMPK